MGSNKSLLDLVIEKTGIKIASNRIASDYEAQKMIASLLSLVAKSDGGISPDENLRMVNLLSKRFGLKSVEALDLVSRAASVLHSDDHLDEVIKSINEVLSRSQKEELVFMVLRVIVADKRKDAAEMKLLAALIDGLKLSDKSVQKIFDRNSADLLG